MTGHEPVLLAEALEGLALIEDGWYVDGTYGRGGHTAQMLAGIGERGRLLALDKDLEAVADGRSKFALDSRFTIEHADFAEFRAVVEPWLGGHALAGVLLDLGVSSPQLDDARRGFSFASEGPLDMRMNTEQALTAASWLARVAEDELADALRRYGEEPRARRIAKAIVAARKHAPLTSTRALAEVVAAAVPAARGRIHPATRVFQALRIVVNEELESLELVLGQALELLAARGRLVVISFHSLEDRIVKRFFARESRGDPAYAGLPQIPKAARPRLKTIGRLIRPDSKEVATNPRARSAKLRIAEKTAE